ncbi:MAG: class I adenylate-forming enzyme family protein [Candidatus Zixiibacteriota bacterium]
MKVSDFLVKTAAAFEEKTAAIHLERHITYGELYRSSAALAERLKRYDLPDGSCAAILFENSIEYLICFFGSLMAGLVAVPLDTSLAPENINFMLADSGAKVFMVQGKYRRQLQQILGTNLALDLIISDKPLVPELPAPLIRIEDILEDTAPIASLSRAAAAVVDAAQAPHELAAIFYTSGSTGEPKGVMLSHRNLVSNTLATVEYLRLTRDDSVLVILPFYYIYGNSLLLTHVACGGHIVIDNRFMYPEVVLDSLEESKATGFAGVPSTFMIALNKSSIAKRKFADLRYITQAGGAMAPEITRRLMEACPRQEIWIMYGQTEASPRVTYLPPKRLEEKLGSIGIPVPGVEVRIIDENGAEVSTGETGEIAVGGPNVMLGYWNQPEATAEVLRDGWLITGDLARRDQDGFIYIVGRKREIIKAAGHRVSAKEIEERILESGLVAEAAVFGVPDDVLGEAIRAVVVLRPGVHADEKQIQGWCQKGLAPFKVPRVVSFVDSLPKYQSGKVNKLALKEQALKI